MTRVGGSPLGRWIPAVQWIARYQRAWLRADTVAGLTMAAILIPQAMGYATLAGLPVQAGLATALAPPLLYALLGGSYRLSVSTTSTLSLLTAEGVRQAGAHDPRASAAALALLAGALLFLAGLLRFGFVVAFVSHPILIGFKIGMALTIAASQLGTILGVPIAGDGVLDRLLSGVARLPQANLATVGIAVASLLLIVTLRRRMPGLPAPLLALAFGLVAVHVGQLTARGVATVGVVPHGLPALALPPVANPSALAIPACAVALMTLVESNAAARTVRQRGEPPIDANQELVALGVAAMAGSVAGSYAPGGGLSQSEVNATLGARTQLASLVAVGMVALTLLWLTPLLTELPMATLGAIVMVAAADLFDVRALRDIAILSRREVQLALATVAFVVGLGVLGGFLAGIAASMLILLYEINHPAVVRLGRDPDSGDWRNVADYPRGRIPAGLLVVQPRGQLYFANVQTVADRIMAMVRQAVPAPTIVVLDASEIPAIDESTIVTLAEFCHDLDRHGMALWLAAVHTRPRAMLAAALATGTLDGVRIFEDLDAALAAFSQRQP